jgi:hypothetical protein
VIHVYTVSGTVFTIEINGQMVDGAINADGTVITFTALMQDVWVKVVEPVTDLSVNCWQSLAGAGNGAPVMTFQQTGAVGTGSVDITGTVIFNYAVSGNDFEVSMGGQSMTGTIEANTMGMGNTIVFHHTETENGDVWHPVPCPTYEPTAGPFELCGDTATEHSVNGYTFCYFEGGVTKDDAAANCATLGLQLAQLHTATKANAVDTFAVYDYTWLGLSCPLATTADCNTGMSGWMWDNGTPLAASENRFMMDGATLFGGGDNEYCAHWWSSPSSPSPSGYATGTPAGEGNWGPQTCSSTYYGSLCEMAVQAAL